MDDNLTIRAERGDEEARSVLIRRHMGMVWGIAIYHLGEPVAAAEVTRKVFVKALTDLDHLPDPRKFRGWLHGIALDLILEVSKASGSAAAGGEGALERIRALPEVFRLPVILRYFQGFSYAKISARVGVRRDQVDRLLRRAKDQTRPPTRA